ncbi:hypothetical protein BD410DRAFT_47006 [Rickenella mellea]|uniref:F-box domain-containing protein n=1 Tax=Rickenella mellea TaxID=50990 RepID=A0A4R5XHL1_9AGAM|nr:hypothetical protein BD410DRAFT_47006 [Rickenella mellea]
MGTRGLFAYRHRKKYYIKYNHWDSYPSGLGADLVDQIPTDKKSFKAWLESKRDFFDEEEERLRDEDFGDDRERGIDGFGGYYEVPSDSPPKNDLFIEWTYTIDLDDNAFTIDMEISFPLDNIPRGQHGCHWISCIGHDASGDRCLRITTPHEFAAIPSRLAPEPSPQDLAMYGKIESNLKLLPQSEWLSQPLSLSQEFALDAAAEVVKLHYFWFYLSQTFQPNRAKFHMLALGLLSIAADGLTFTPRKKYNSEDKREGLVHFASWAKETCNRPRNEFMWLRGVLVYLTSHLDVEDNRKASVGSVVSAIQELKLDYCVAVLFSINHIVVVKVVDGVVYESEVIELLAALPDPNWKERLITGLKPLIHVFRLPQFTDIAEMEPDASVSQFPTEILLQVLESTDNETYDQFSKLSKTWRGICKKYLRLGPYTIIGRDNDAFIARVANGPATRIKLFWICKGNLHKSDGIDCYEVYLKPQHVTEIRTELPTQSEVGVVGGNFVQMRLRPPRYRKSTSASDIGVVIAEEGTDLEQTMIEKVKKTMEEEVEV